MRYVDRARSAAAAPFVTVDFPSAYFRRMIIGKRYCLQNAHIGLDNMF